MPSPSRCPECDAELPPDGFAGLCPKCVAGTLDGLWDVLNPPPPAASSSTAQPTVRGWDLLEPLGAGGQGIVWHAVRQTDDAQGALKVFRPKELGDDELALRLEAEVSALRALDHPGIVSVLDSGVTHDGQFFIVTEHVEGCDLQRLMLSGLLGSGRSLEIVRQVAAALAHAHERGIVHRDLKPANVLISRAGSVKLADFSLARHASRQQAVVSMTLTGTTFGTPYYLAPEIMRGQGASTSSDLYALGVMLYELLTGAPPAGKFGRVSEKCGMPRALDSLVESLLAEQPEKRPASASTVIQHLDQISRLHQDDLAGRVRRHRWKLAACLLAGILTAGLTGYFLARPVAAKPALPSVNARGFPNPAIAARTRPWNNSLDMAFIPVPGLPGLLVGRHEVRMKDMMTYSQQAFVDPEWRAAYGGDIAARAPITDLRPSGWENVPNLPFGLDLLMVMHLQPEAAACGVNAFQAKRFCSWLTWREQKEGRLSPGEHYRLPTDEEWSLAAGLPPETEPEVEKRHEALPKGSVLHPWGRGWPPPRHFGNFAGTEARDAHWPPEWLSLPAANDDFPRAAPVASLAESKTGLHDLWGNVWEWCDTQRNLISNQLTLRGGSWVDGAYRGQLRVDHRRFERPSQRQTSIGFRCVLVVPTLPR